MNKIILKLENISKSFPGVKALNKVNLNIYKNEAMALLGENGAGKSTLIKILSGIYKKDEGNIYIDDELVDINSVNDSQKYNIAVIHQELNLIPNLTVAENIFLGREPKNGIFIDKKKMYSESKEILNRLGVNISEREYISNLSIASQQMVEIAKALSVNARIIIMDEPTDALTDKEVEVLFNVISELKKQNKSIIYISHRLTEIFEVCEKITVLRDGKFIAEESIDNLDENKIINLMVGREIKEQFPYIPIQGEDEILKVENLTNEYIKNISFNLKGGEVLGIAGLVGAGRSELAKTLYGFYGTEKGNVSLENKILNLKNTSDAIKQGITYVSEDRKKDGLILPMNISENITISSLEKISSLFKISKKKEIDVSNEFVKKMNIKTPSLNQKIKNLSGGNQQKVSIAKGLMNKTKVLILDEPTRGVDVGAKTEIYEIINSLKKEKVGIIMISSEMPELLGMSDRIMVMHDGIKKGELKREEANQEAIMSMILS
ncbi:MAG: sugar ABC transporter ATP-binding protein [Peptoniphilus sp.]|uniref:sugar ABC transporter ATP-binding protein n=1 Tax=Peptoniphilus sp. TaxID=1971214 RepID=UPI002A74DA22|nr:sugar ABC transporter ATP-binding protein [Peptoniphilus sp.]MDY2986966.1 sugar ABC transporter ATP-binding protein [Peptoniphilus sp.]